MRLPWRETVFLHSKASHCPKGDLSFFKGNNAWLDALRVLFFRIFLSFVLLAGFSKQSFCVEDCFCLQHEEFRGVKWNWNADYLVDTISDQNYMQAALEKDLADLFHLFFAG